MRLLGEPSARKVKSPNGEKLPRSKTGCLTCRRRRIKCGEEKPICHRCARRSLQCKYGQLASKPRDQFIFKDATPNPPVECFGSNSSETSMSASNFWDVPKAEHINAERRQAFFDFVDLGPFNADGTIHTFITKFWPVDPTSHNAVCIYEFSQTFGVSSTKSYKYCFRAVLMYISSLDKMLANMTLALALANANEYDLATTYYNEAMTSLEALIARIDEKSPSFDTVIALAAIWFMTQYEMFYHGDILLLQKHFDTFTDFIENNGNGSLPLSSLTDPPDSILADELIPGTVTTRLVVWTTYHDSMASSFGVGGRLSTLISSQVSINGLDLLRHRSQQSSQEMWQSYYPYEELFDDVVNQDIFQLHHHSLVIRFKTTQLQKKWLEGEFDDKLALNIMEHYESISQVCIMIFPFILVFLHLPLLLTQAFFGNFERQRRSCRRNSSQIFS